MKGKLHNKTLNQSTYNDEYIDEKFDELTPIDGVLVEGDVVNNLTSTEATKPLSAAQGRQLDLNKANRNGGNTLTGTQRVVNQATNPNAEIQVSPWYLSIRDNNSGKMTQLNSDSLEFTDHNGNEHTISVEDGKLMFDGEEIGTGGSGGSGSGGHFRITDFEISQQTGDGNARISSPSHKISHQELYFIYLSIGNQGGTWASWIPVGLCNSGETVDCYLAYTGGGGNGPYGLSYHIADGELVIENTGSSYVDVGGFIHIGSGGSSLNYKSFDIERINFWASSQQWYGWRRTDGTPLEVGLPYILEGTYYGEPVNITFDQDGYGHDNLSGYDFWIMNNSSLNGCGVVGGLNTNYSPFEFEKIHVPVEPNFDFEENTDSMLCSWVGNSAKIVHNEMLYSMSGQIQYEATFWDVLNSKGLEGEELKTHIALTRKMFEPIEELFGMSPGDMYDSMEWMFEEINQYCQSYSYIDLENPEDWTIYSYLEEIFQMLMIVDQIDPKLMSLAMDYKYVCEHSGDEISVTPLGLIGSKGGSLIIIPYVKDIGRLML